MFQLNKNLIFIGIAILAVVITGLLIFVNLNSGMSAEVIAKKSVDYLNGSVLQGQTATLVSFGEESGVIKINIKIGDKSYDSYITKDGKLLFPEGLKVGSNPINNPTGQNQNTQAPVQSVQPTQAPVQPTQ